MSLTGARCRAKCGQLCGPYVCTSLKLDYIRSFELNYSLESLCFSAFIVSANFLADRSSSTFSAVSVNFPKSGTAHSDLDHAYLRRLPNGRYEAVRNHSDLQSRLFGRFNLVFESFQQFAEEVQRQADNNDNTQVRRIPHFERRGPGKPKGSTNKKPDTAQTETVQPKRRPGRPKGSKNKATLAHEAAEALLAPKPKRKPGRPKGSLNKKTIERLEREKALAEAVAAKAKRGRGRP